MTTINCSLHNVSKIYTQCITITGAPRNAKTQLFLSLYAGFTLYTFLNEERMKKKNFVITQLDDQLDFLVTFNLAQARRYLKAIRNSTNPISDEANQLEEVVNKITKLYDLSLQNDISATHETINEYVFNKIWEYTHDKMRIR